MDALASVLPAMAPGLVPGAIPSPPQGVWNLGPIPIRAYALIIVAGIIVAVWWGNRRYIQRGGAAGTIGDIAIWAVPFGIIGARLYHVITDWQIYFGPGGSGIIGALRIWDGGLGIWGAISLGALGAWIACRRRGILMPPVADAIAPAIAVAQAMGRWGNYFNQELYGAPTTLPWGLQIDAAHAPRDASGSLIYPPDTLFQPTFLYESLWLAAMAVVLVWADRRFRMGHGRVFALYVTLYCTGRVWIESLRIDSANTILGLRLNVWTSIIVGLGGLIYLVLSARRNPGREEVLVRESAEGPSLTDGAGEDPSEVAVEEDPSGASAVEKGP